MSEVAMSMKEVIFQAYILPLTLYKYVIRRDLWLEYSSASISSWKWPAFKSVSNILKKKKKNTGETP
jgi:hypothetical protein